MGSKLKQFFFKYITLGLYFSGLGLKYLCPAEPIFALLNLSSERAQQPVMSPFLSKWPVLLFMFIGCRAVQEALFKQIR